MPIITCPHCGAVRNTPLDRLPQQKTRARCPECRQHFAFDPASRRIKATEPPGQLSGIGTLLTRSWELFCRRGWGLFLIYLVGAVLILTPLTIAALYLPTLVINSPALIWSCIILGIAYALFGATWITAGMFHHIVDPQRNTRTAISKGWSSFGSFFRLLLLMTVVVAGGSLLFLIPGIIFTIWFLFSQFILAEEGLGSLAALDKSRELVKGYGWQVFSRLLLLLLIFLSVSTLTSRLPVVGEAANLLSTLLMVPFSLIYTYLIYRDLKQCHPFVQSQPSSNHRWPYLTIALLGWLLIPAVFGLVHRQDLIALADSNLTFLKEANRGTEMAANLFGLMEDQSQQEAYPIPKDLTIADYDRLIREKSFPTDLTEGHPSPAVFSGLRFWLDERNPHFWLEVRLADLPNLTLSARRSARVMIEKVLDTDQQDQYDRQHSFESGPFQWIDIRTDKKEKILSGIRSVYLKEGARPEQISKIVGRLELTLPLRIKTLQLHRQDVGKVFSVAGKALKLESLESDRLSLSFQGELQQILSVRAYNPEEKPLLEEGEIWQSDGRLLNLQNMFNGQIDAVTVLVATDTLTRSYPFEISH